MRLIMIILIRTNLKPTSNYIKLWKGALALSISINISFNIILISKYIKSTCIIIRRNIFR